ncbi:UDP-galactopyranose mutase [Bosea sp. 124]|uniref:UDP-galactopyranose mutase n=1 Tax=Bosea sp. 124 TaxID=2135642 RepID=UPI000D378A6F|nr:UDP-galactopyranose mutase [Bosea sp. 124]PTM41752.1 UDP-galactopyranose mutase [Bosea sp. 124]
MIPRTLIVGAGFSGAVIAERIASQLGRHVLLIDQRTHIAGNAYDCLDEHGVLIHKYGPHIFHTNSQRVVTYLSQFTGWTPYEHRVRGLVEGEWVPLPFNLTSFEILFGRSEGQRLIKLLTDEFGVGIKVPILDMRNSASGDVRRVADLLYEKVFLHYTVKQWGLRPEELDASVSARVPVMLSRDDRYFQDSFQFMPMDGYSSLFERMVAHPLIEVQTSLSYLDAVASEAFERIVFTGPIDEFFSHRHGALPYRSIRFDMRSEAAATPVQGWTVENYPTPAEQHPFTRSTEFRLLTGQHGISHTTRAFEYPEAFEAGKNEPYYPIPRAENRALFRLYEADARKLKTVHFVGRLADYNYYNMDQAVASALACFDRMIDKAASLS